MADRERAEVIRLIEHYSAHVNEPSFNEGDARRLAELASRLADIIKDKMPYTITKDMRAALYGG